MFFIKIKLKGYLKNITENKIENIETVAIKNKNNISFYIDGIQHKITILKNKVIIFRDNEEFSHKLEFEKEKQNNTEYYIKEYNTSIEISLKTTELYISDNKIKIKYQIIDSKEEYLYLIEMSE